MVFMYHFFDFSDFTRFLYDKIHQNFDFFEETLLELFSFACLDPEMRHFELFLNANTLTFGFLVFFDTM